MKRTNKYGVPAYLANDPIFKKLVRDIRKTPAPASIAQYLVDESVVRAADEEDRVENNSDMITIYF
jgi:hypothetical protein